GGAVVAAEARDGVDHRVLLVRFLVPSLRQPDAGADLDLAAVELGESLTHDLDDARSLGLDEGPSVGHLREFEFNGPRSGSIEAHLHGLAVQVPLAESRVRAVQTAPGDRLDG